MNRLVFFLLLLFQLNCQAQLKWYPVTNIDLNEPVLTLFTDTATDKLFIGGNFRYYGNIRYNGVAQWDGNQLLNMDCGLGGCGVGFCGGVRQFEKFNNELYAVFFEDSIGCQNIHHISKWNGLSWINLNQNFFMNSSPTLSGPMYLIDSSLIVSGGFDSINNLKVHGITKFSGTSWDTVFYCSLFNDSYLVIRPLIKYNNQIYAQNLLRDTTNNRQIFSRWVNSCWEKVPGAFSNSSGSINKMIVYKNELYIAGAFDSIHDPQAPGHSIAKWDGNHWSDIGGGVRLSNPNYLPVIYDMAVFNNELYVAGIFEKAGGLDVSNIAKWDGSNWCSFGNTFNGAIEAISFYHDSLFVGGSFTLIDNDTTLYFAKSHIGSYADTCENVNRIYELITDKINIFPNPVNDMLRIQSSKIKIDKIEITDILGKEIYSVENSEMHNQIDISFLSSGLYFLLIETKQGRVVKKFVKE